MNNFEEKMRNLKVFCLFLILCSIAVLQSCTISELQEGEFCPPLPLCCPDGMDSCEASALVSGAPCTWSEQRRDSTTGRCKDALVCQLSHGVYSCVDCKDGQKYCETDGVYSCADTSSNARHCGDCGVACAPGEACVDGQCFSNCPSGQIMCGEGIQRQCVDPLSSNLFCGASGDCEGVNAGSVCDRGNVCTSEGCRTSCTPGLIICEGQCINPQNDNKFCGATEGQCSEKKCPSGEVCTGGSCSASCLSGQVLCNGKCIVALSDNNHCGAKGTCEGSDSSDINFVGERCPSGQLCSGGTCSASCGREYTICDETCVDLRTNMSHCGACSTPCSPNKVANSTAVYCQDTCKALSCKTGYILSGGRCTTADMNNCGARGIVCSEIQPGWSTGACTNGQCMANSCLDGYHLNKKTHKCVADTSECCGEGCVQCNKSDVCNKGLCTQPAVSCRDQEQNCNNTCVNLMDNQENCGYCNYRCNDDENCKNGYCFSTKNAYLVALCHLDAKPYPFGNFLGYDRCKIRDDEKTPYCFDFDNNQPVPCEGDPHADIGMIEPGFLNPMGGASIAVTARKMDSFPGSICYPDDGWDYREEKVPFDMETVHCIMTKQHKFFVFVYKAGDNKLSAYIDWTRSY